MMKKLCLAALLMVCVAAFVCPTAASARTQSQCSAAGLRWVFAESDLDSDLSVSVTFANYSSRVSYILKLYRRVPFKRETLSCINSVEVPAEQAMHHYVSAQSVWATCIPRGGCDANHEAQLQRHWRQAAHAIDRAATNAT